MKSFLLSIPNISSFILFIDTILSRLNLSPYLIWQLLFLLYLEFSVILMVVEVKLVDTLLREP